MEGITATKISDLEELFKGILEILAEIKKLKENEDQAKAYSIQQAADMLNLSYDTVRRMVIKKKIFAKYIDGENGKCVIPLWAIKDYLKSNENTNQLKK